MAKKEKKTTNKKENNKNKKSFFKDFKAELKKVVWPTPKQLINNTTAVVTIVLITASIVFALDFTFESINKHGVDKVKQLIEQTDSSSEENDNTENTVENETVNEENSENNETEQNESEVNTENNAE